MTDTAITELVPVVGVKAACVAVGRPRATHYPVAPHVTGTATAAT